MALPGEPTATNADAAAAAGGTARAPAAWRQRWRAWWEARVPASDTLTLVQRNVYILPTRAGLMFGLTLLILLVASINYQLNLGYALTFLLAGSGIASMHATHATLRGLKLHLRPVASGFAGEPTVLEVVMTSEGRARHGIGLRVAREAGDAYTWTDVPAGSQATAAVSFVPARRGWHAVPTLHVETRFPLGLFRAWALFRPASQALAYPAPERPAASLPAPQSGDADPRASTAGGGEPDGVRRYRPGDPLRMVVWKKYARSGELVSRDTGPGAAPRLWLDHALAPGDLEARLSRLAAWVLDAERAGADYGLRLPALQIAPGQGDAHRQRCLEALALWH